MSLNISDFNLLCDNCTPPLPPKKKSPPLSQQPPLKVEVLSSPLFKIWLEAQPPLPKGGGGGAYYVTLTETDKMRLESCIRLLFAAHPELLNSRVALYFPSDLNHPLKFD